MFSLLVIIYIAFISLGLPDSILGSAWPLMYGDLGVELSYAGIITMIIACGTVVSSLLSDKVIRRLGTGMVTAISVALTAASLLGFSFARHFYILCILAVPYGLGAGSVDAALNNYVALHFKARHMSFLHCFWGIGATLGPAIMGLFLTNGFSWNSGYRAIGGLQVLLSAILLVTLPLWAKQNKLTEQNKLKENASALLSEEDTARAEKPLGLPGAKSILLAFFCYSAVEQSAGLWASSFVVFTRGVAPETAAQWGSLFFIGITFGRFLSGFISEKFGDKKMIRMGQIMIICGALLLFIPAAYVNLSALILIGLGCAPVYPSIIHETPATFGAANSQAMIGIQMACAYTGTTLMPPLFGLIAQYASLSLLPVWLLGFAVIMMILVEHMNHAVKKTTC